MCCTTFQASPLQAIQPQHKGIELVSVCVGWKRCFAAARPLNHPPTPTPQKKEKKKTLTILVEQRLIFVVKHAGWERGAALHPGLSWWLISAPLGVVASGQDSWTREEPGGEGGSSTHKVNKEKDKTKNLKKKKSTKSVWLKKPTRVWQQNTNNDKLS